MDLTPSGKLKQFFVTSRPIFYKKGEIVLRVGETRLGAFYVKSGYIKDLTVSSEGRTFNLFIFEPGDLFSYNWIYNKTPNEHTFKAMTDCITYEKTREELLLFLEQNSDVQFMISQKIVKRMNGLIQRMEHMALGTASQKVSSILSILAERFGKKTSKGTTIPIYLTQQDLAELIGISRETASTEINKLSAMGVIVRSSGNYSVTDLEKLNSSALIS